MLVADEQSRRRFGFSLGFYHQFLAFIFFYIFYFVFFFSLDGYGQSFVAPASSLLAFPFLQSIVDFAPGNKQEWLLWFT